MEKIPHNTAAILVWYHGPVPIDYISLVSKLYLRDGRMVNSVVDKFITGNATLIEELNLYKISIMWYSVLQSITKTV